MRMTSRTPHHNVGLSSRLPSIRLETRDGLRDVALLTADDLLAAAFDTGHPESSSTRS
jgi:hypothetical protein